jgi:hypothetical protein
MDLKSLSMGERIAAASGAVLFLLLFTDWLEDGNAWESLAFADILLALLALVAVALPLARAVGAEPPLRPSNREILTRAGFVALLVIATLILEKDDKGVGIFLSLLVAGGLLYGGMTTPRPDAPPRRRERPRPPRAHEDFGEPPPGMESWRSGVGAPSAEAGAEEGAAAPSPPGGSRTAEPDPTEVRSPRRPPEGGAS